MGKKFLLINGSPRKNGLTATMIERFSKKVAEINQKSEIRVDLEVLHIYDYTIKHCSGCDKCLKRPHSCPLSENDDMPIIEEKMINSDAIVVGAPAYFANIPSLMKVLIDRSRPMKMAKYKLRDRIFSVLTTAGLRGGGVNFVQDTLIHFALIQGMIVVGALGHPVLVANLPSETLQMQGLTEFRSFKELSEVSNVTTDALAERIFDLLIK